jgi:hypothetical protein
MSTEHAIANVIIVGLCGALLTRLYLREYKDLRAQITRSQLFAVRDELFETARQGKIPFGAPAYRLLRERINGSIRLAHKLNLIEVYVLYWTINRSPALKAGQARFQREWTASLAALPEDARNSLETIRRKHSEIVVKQIVFCSWGTFALLTPFAALGWMARLLAATTNYALTPRALAKRPQAEVEYYAVHGDGMPTAA